MVELWYHALPFKAKWTELAIFVSKEFLSSYAFQDIATTTLSLFEKPDSHGSAIRYLTKFENEWNLLSRLGFKRKRLNHPANIMKQKAWKYINNSCRCLFLVDGSQCFVGHCLSIPQIRNSRKSSHGCLLYKFNDGKAILSVNHGEVVCGESMDTLRGVVMPDVGDWSDH